ncbi:hypothetical protein M513_02115 [Trichuris suis]|uniref:Uncharacterized protein n=1 Tax=Trichuris suis TaxID=68888 RepID=A0A085MI12_9BILA|nr:hypothetical protein M513_02115 [Trichuris suis]
MVSTIEPRRQADHFNLSQQLAGAANVDTGDADRRPSKHDNNAKLARRKLANETHVDTAPSIIEESTWLSEHQEHARCLAVGC